MSKQMSAEEELAWEAERDEKRFAALGGAVNHPYPFMLGATQSVLSTYDRLARPILKAHAPAHVLAQLDDAMERLERLEKEFLP